MIGYKLFRKRKDGSLGPLFINRRARLPLNQWLDAEDHPTKGYAHRPGWHACARPVAPHLSEKGRIWYEVELDGVTRFDRPTPQGGLWLLAERMRILRPVEGECTSSGARTQGKS